MFKSFVFGLLLVVTGHFAEGTTIYDNGPSNQMDGENISGLVAADDISLNGSATIRTASIFISTDQPSFDLGTLLNVDWFIFANDNGSPGMIISTGTDSSPLFTDTGSQEFGNEEYKMFVSLPSVALTPGTYWLGIHSTLTSDNNDMYWDTTSSIHGANAMANSYPASPGNWYEGLSGTNGTDLAYSLSDEALVTNTPEPNMRVLVGLFAVGIALFTRLRKGSRRKNRRSYSASL